MERGAESKQSSLVCELMRGQELSRQLMINLDQPNITGFCKPLASEILLYIDRALCIAKANDLESPGLAPYSYGATDSIVSPRSENSEQASKELQRREMSKKRKTLPKWTSQVMTVTEGLEGPVDDGYSWRKYGQKDILGANHPRLVLVTLSQNQPPNFPFNYAKSDRMCLFCRGYYRCTHRSTRGCLATKQVQRSDQNPSILDVSYRGAHICQQRPQLVSPPPERKQKQSQSQELRPLIDNIQLQPHQPDLLLSFQTDLRIRTNVGCMNHDNIFFSSPSAVENCFNSNFSPSFISSATSESTFCGGGPNPQTAESDYRENVTGASSASGSPLIDMDFLLEFDADFPFDTSTFFA